MKNRKSTSFKNRLLAGVVTSAFLCLPGYSLSSPAHELTPYGQKTALTDMELDSIRGTYIVGGIEFTMGLEQLTRLNGDIIDSTTINLENMFGDDGLFGEDGVFGEGGVFGDGSDVGSSTATPVIAATPDIPSGGSVAPTPAPDAGTPAIANIPVNIPTADIPIAPSNNLTNPVQIKAPEVNIVNPVVTELANSDITPDIPVPNTPNVFGKGGSPLSPTNIPTPTKSKPSTPIATPDIVGKPSPLIASAPTPSPVARANAANLGRIISINSDSVNIQRVPGFNTFIQNSRSGILLQYTQVLNITADGVKAQRALRQLGDLATQSAMFSLK